MPATARAQACTVSVKAQGTRGIGLRGVSSVAVSGRVMLWVGPWVWLIGKRDYKPTVGMCAEEACENMNGQDMQDETSLLIPTGRPV